MLAAHRDQENRVLSHQLAAKQQPKTPGVRHVKTPLRLGGNDENAPTVIGGKSAIKGGPIAGGKDKLRTKGSGTRQVISTPTETRARAPLGNKTTNAKAKNTQQHGVGVKDIVKEIEKTQTKQSTILKPKSNQTELASRKVTSEKQRNRHQDVEEPEYAPPRPEALPYESDVLPEGGLTFEGIKGDNLMKGFYEHFYNPLDANGMPHMDRQLEEEMKTVLERAMGRNDEETEQLTWNADDIPQGALPPKEKRPNQLRAITHVTGKRPSRAPPKPVPTVASRHAASALGVQPGSSIALRQCTQPRSLNPTKSLPSVICRPRPERALAERQNLRIAGSAGEATSRTTIGYTKGRSASSTLQNGEEGGLTQSARQTKTDTIYINDENSHLTHTPTRHDENGLAVYSLTGNARPQFTSIFEGRFDVDNDDDDLPQINIPFLDSEDEEFELRLDI